MSKKAPTRGDGERRLGNTLWPKSLWLQPQLPTVTIANPVCPPRRCCCSERLASRFILTLL